MISTRRGAMDSGFEVFLYAGFVFFLSGEGEGGEKGKDTEMKDPTVSLILCWGNGWMSRSFLFGLVWPLFRGNSYVDWEKMVFGEIRVYKTLNRDRRLCKT